MAANGDTNLLEHVRGTHGKERKHLREAMRHRWRNPPHCARSVITQLERAPAQRLRAKDLRRQRLSKYAITDGFPTADHYCDSDCDSSEAYDTDTWQLVRHADAVSITIAELLKRMHSVPWDLRAAVNLAVGEAVHSYILASLT